MKNRSADVNTGYRCEGDQEGLTNCNREKLLASQNSESRQEQKQCLESQPQEAKICLCESQSRGGQNLKVEKVKKMKQWTRIVKLMNQRKRGSVWMRSSQKCSARIGFASQPSFGLCILMR